MQDFEYVTESAPGDITPDRIARRAANGMSKFFGVVASSMAVAGGLFAGNVLTAPNQGLNGTEGPIGVDGAFADDSGAAAGGAPGQAAANGLGGAASNAVAGYLPAGSSFSKPGAIAGSKPGATSAPGIVPVKGVDFGNTTNATAAAGTGTTTGTTTNATTATSGTGTTTGTTTNATTATSGSGKDDGDDGDDGDDKDKDKDKDDGD